MGVYRPLLPRITVGFVLVLFGIVTASGKSPQEDLHPNGSDATSVKNQARRDIFFDQMRNITVPADDVQGHQALQALVRNIYLLQTTKELFSQEDIRNFLPKPKAVHQPCYDDVMDFLDALIGERKDASSTDYVTKPWAFRMFDAFGKPAAGFLRGTLHWVGNYDECLELHARIPADTHLGSRATPRNSTSDFYARYCRVEILLPKIKDMTGKEHSGFWKEREESPNLLHWGTCFPEACTARDVKLLLTEGTLAAVPLQVEKVICFDRDPDIGSDAGAIFAVSAILGCTFLESAVHYGYITLKGGQIQGHSSDSERIVQGSAENSKHQAHCDDQPRGNKGRSSSFKLNDKTPLASKSWPKDVIRDESNGLKNHETRSSRNSDGQKASTGLRLLQTFSLRHNGGKLVSTTTSPDPGLFASIQGLRVISIGWVMLAHTYTVGGAMDARNYLAAVLAKIPETVNRTSYTIILGANLAVDTFFVISGVLVMALTLRELRKGKGRTVGFWIMFYVHRIWRLTPVYMIVLMTGTTLYDYIVEGPLKSDPYLMFEHCPSHWWTNLLYINNLAYPNQECMFWTWYLGVDMQLFVLSPILILLVHRHPQGGYLAMTAVIILGTIGTFIVTFYNPGLILTGSTTNTEYWEYVYRAPWSRIAVFTVGMLVGVVLEDVQDKPQWSKVKTALVWLMSFAVAIFVIVIPHNQLKEGAEFWPKGTQALYEALSRLAWSLFIGWVIFACQSGLGGLLTRLLTWTAFQPLARLTYTVYLVHPMVITFFLYSRNFPVDMEDSVMIYRYLGNVILSFLVGAVFSLSFEAPSIGVEKILLGRP